MTPCPLYRNPVLKFVIATVDPGIARYDFKPGAIIGHTATTDIPADVHLPPAWRDRLGP